MHRRVSLLLTVLLVVASCTSSSDPTTTTSTADGPSSTAVDTTSSTTDQAPATTSTTPTPVVESIELLGEPLAAEVEEQLIALLVATQEVRGLNFITPPKVRVVTSDELQRLVIENIEENSEDFPADEALYQALGLISDSADLETIVSDLYGEQVAGFYDGETKEMVVPARDQGFTPLQQATVVHELVHALTDQHFDFHTAYDAMFEEDRLDEAASYQALIEGDATLAELEWIQTLTPGEIGALLAETLEIDDSSLNDAPRFLVESLIFPYDFGLTFAQSLFADGGWAAVNDAYAQLQTDGSTEQILEPSDFGVELPIDVDIPLISLPGYQLERTSVWGEQGFRVLLNQGSGVTTLATATDGWGGDAYHQWFDGDNAALLVVYEGDSTRDVDEMEEALVAFDAEMAPSDSYVEVRRVADTIFFIVADEPAAGESILLDLDLD